jgi:hypothetical protein
MCSFGWIVMTQHHHPQQPALSPGAKQQPEVPHLATSVLQSIKSMEKIKAPAAPTGKG